MRTIATCVYGVLALILGMFVEIEEPVAPGLAFFLAFVCVIAFGALTAWLDDD